MRVAAITDIHASAPALEHVLREIDSAQLDEIWCLGDIVGLGRTDPLETVDLVREHCAIALAGNHDRWITGTLSLNMLPLPRQRTELDWQRRQLGKERLRWLAGLPSHASHKGVGLWHGSASDPVTGWIANGTDADEHLADQLEPIGLVGHTHRPMVASLIADEVRFRVVPDREDLAPDERVVMNPGAVIGMRRWLELDLGPREATWHVVDG
jgi:predicted phosphodiesterase